MDDGALLLRRAIALFAVMSIEWASCVVCVVW
jgi:hypothetical protein